MTLAEGRDGDPVEWVMGAEAYQIPKQSLVYITSYKRAVSVPQ